MVYALILTTYIFGIFNSSPVAVTQTSTPGFTNEKLCKNAGKIAQAGAVQPPSNSQQTVVTYLCVPLTL